MNSKRPATTSSAKKAPAKKAPTKKAPTKKAPTKKAPTKKAPTKKAASSTSKKAAARKAVAEKAPAKKAAPKKAAPKKAAPKKAVPKKTAASKAPATKATAKKAGSPTSKKAGSPTSKKAGAKKAPAEKATAKKATAKKAPARKATAKAAKSPFDVKFLEAQKALLLEERRRLVHDAESLTAEANSLAELREPGDVQFDEESGEGDTLAVERERDLALSAQFRHQVEEIDHAMAKFELGTYGICEVSGQPIPKERLKAIPWARERVEHKVGGFGRR